MLRHRAAWALTVGDFDRARSLADQANQIAEAIGDVSAIGVHRGFTVYVALLRGYGPVLPPEPEVLQNVPPLPVVLAIRAAALLVNGQTAAAAAAYRALPLDALDPGDPMGPAMLPFLIHLATALRDPAGCRHVGAVLQAVQPVAPVLGDGTAFFLGSVARARAEVATIADGPDAAIPCFEEGLRIDGMLGARPYLVRGRTGLAAALLERGRADDLQRAADLAGARGRRGRPARHAPRARRRPADTRQPRQADTRRGPVDRPGTGRSPPSARP